MASESKIPKKTQSLIEKLRSTESKIVVQTIRLLEAEGDEHILRPLLDTYKANTVEATRNAVVEFFNKLSDSRAINEMIQMIREEENADVRKMLIASCWQNKLDFTAYLPDFVALATEGDFFEAFECLTVIENLEGPFEETQILESQLYLKEFLEGEKGKSEQKDKIVSEIAVLLKDFDQNIEA